MSWERRNALIELVLLLISLPFGMLWYGSEHVELIKEAWCNLWNDKFQYGGLSNGS